MEHIESYFITCMLSPLPLERFKMYFSVSKESGGKIPKNRSLRLVCSVRLMATSDQPVITIDFSRILIEQGRYIQRINLNRIINELEAKTIITPPTAMGLRGVNDEYEKSSIVTGILQGRKEKDFKTFLKIIAKEKAGSKFYEATKMFFSAFTMFPGYEQYATWPNGKLIK